ncbi:hypothetical protein DKX38_018769 [Salix brachista]|uniref:Uncharacterized protein n=1 Tax=Salix brachista TaxID=2182728 RepID=A0A5N5KNY8_9ROSI|nr:hypothetical protein DKX38_018769 [Salix brachista]
MKGTYLLPCRAQAYVSVTRQQEQKHEERNEFIASLHERKTEFFMALIGKKLLPLGPGVAKLWEKESKLLSAALPMRRPYAQPGSYNCIARKVVPCNLGFAVDKY